MTLDLDWKQFSVEVDRSIGKVAAIDQIEFMEARYVYVIETPTDLPIAYSKGVSRICYIGRSARDKSKRSRLNSHATGWIFKYLALNPNSKPFNVSYCYPRRQNFSDAYIDIEAYLLRIFHEQFGSTPLFNKKNERELADYDVKLNGRLFSPLRVAPVISAFAVADEAAIEE